MKTTLLSRLAALRRAEAEAENAQREKARSLDDGACDAVDASLPSDNEVPLAEAHPPDGSDGSHSSPSSSSSSSASPLEQPAAEPVSARHHSGRDDPPYIRALLGYDDVSFAARVGVDPLEHSAVAPPGDADVGHHSPSTTVSACAAPPVAEPSSLSHETSPRADNSGAEGQPQPFSDPPERATGDDERGRLGQEQPTVTLPKLRTWGSVNARRVVTHSDPSSGQPINADGDRRNEAEGDGPLGSLTDLFRSPGGSSVGSGALSPRGGIRRGVSLRRHVTASDDGSEELAAFAELLWEVPGEEERYRPSFSGPGYELPPDASDIEVALYFLSDGGTRTLTQGDGVMELITGEVNLEDIMAGGFRGTGEVDEADRIPGDFVLDECAETGSHPNDHRDRSVDIANDGASSKASRSPRVQFVQDKEVFASLRSDTARPDLGGSALRREGSPQYARTAAEPPTSHATNKIVARGQSDRHVERNAAPVPPQQPGTLRRLVSRLGGMLYARHSAHPALGNAPLPVSASAPGTRPPSLSSRGGRDDDGFLPAFDAARPGLESDTPLVSWVTTTTRTRGSSSTKSGTESWSTSGGLAQSQQMGLGNIQALASMVSAGHNWSFYDSPESSGNSGSRSPPRSRSPQRTSSHRRRHSGRQQKRSAHDSPGHVSFSSQPPLTTAGSDNDDDEALREREDDQKGQTHASIADDDEVPLQRDATDVFHQNASATTATAPQRRQQQQDQQREDSSDTARASTSGDSSGDLRQRRGRTAPTFLLENEEEGTSNTRHARVPSVSHDSDAPIRSGSLPEPISSGRRSPSSKATSRFAAAARETVSAASSGRTATPPRAVSFVGVAQDPPAPDTVKTAVATGPPSTVEETSLSRHGSTSQSSTLRTVSEQSRAGTPQSLTSPRTSFQRNQRPKPPSIAAAATAMRLALRERSGSNRHSPTANSVLASRRSSSAPAMQRQPHSPLERMVSSLASLRRTPSGAANSNRDTIRQRGRGAGGSVADRMRAASAMSRIAAHRGSLSALVTAATQQRRSETERSGRDDRYSPSSSTSTRGGAAFQRSAMMLAALARKGNSKRVGGADSSEKLDGSGSGRSRESGSSSRLLSMSRTPSSATVSRGSSGAAGGASRFAAATQALVSMRQGVRGFAPKPKSSLSAVSLLRAVKSSGGITTNDGLHAVATFDPLATSMGTSMMRSPSMPSLGAAPVGGSLVEFAARVGESHRRSRAAAASIIGGDGRRRRRSTIPPNSSDRRRRSSAARANDMSDSAMSDSHRSESGRRRSLRRQSIREGRRRSSAHSNSGRGRSMSLSDDAVPVRSISHAMKAVRGAASSSESSDVSTSSSDGESVSDSESFASSDETDRMSWSGLSDESEIFTQSPQGIMGDASRSMRGEGGSGNEARPRRRSSARLRSHKDRSQASPYDGVLPPALQAAQAAANSDGAPRNPLAGAPIDAAVDDDVNGGESAQDTDESRGVVDFVKDQLDKVAAVGEAIQAPAALRAAEWVHRIRDGTDDDEDDEEIRRQEQEERRQQRLRALEEESNSEDEDDASGAGRRRNKGRRTDEQSMSKEEKEQHRRERRAARIQRSKEKEKRRADREERRRKKAEKRRKSVNDIRLAKAAAVRLPIDFVISHIRQEVESTKTLQDAFLFLPFFTLFLLSFLLSINITEVNFAVESLRRGDTNTSYPYVGYLDGFLRMTMPGLRGATDESAPLPQDADPLVARPPRPAPTPYSVFDKLGPWEPELWPIPAVGVPSAPRRRTFRDIRTPRHWAEWFVSVFLAANWHCEDGHGGCSDGAGIGKCSVDDFSTPLGLRGNDGAPLLLSAARLRVIRVKKGSCSGDGSSVLGDLWETVLGSGTGVDGGGGGTTPSPAPPTGGASTPLTPSPNTLPASSSSEDGASTGSVDKAKEESQCYGAYSSSSASRESFCNQPNPMLPSETLFGYADCNVLFDEADRDRYPCSGHTATLPFNSTCAKAKQLARLLLPTLTDRERAWANATHDVPTIGYDISSEQTGNDTRCDSFLLHASTRFIAVDYYMMNKPQSTLHRISLMVEVTAAGSWTPFEVSRVFEIWTPRYHLFRTVFDIVLLVGVCVFFARLYDQWTFSTWQTGRAFAFFLDPWNLLEFTNLSMFLVSLIMRLVWWAASVAIDVDEVFAPAQFPEQLDALAVLYTTQTYTNAVNIILSFLKLFRFVKMNDRLNVLSRTLSSVQGSLASVLFLFGLMTAGFALAGVQLYGGRLDAFRNVNSAYSSLLFMLLGQIDYASMRELEPTFTFLYVLGFILLGQFILLNLIIVVLSDGFAAENARSAAEPLASVVMRQLDAFRLVLRPAYAVEFFTRRARRDTRVSVLQRVAVVLERHRTLLSNAHLQARVAAPEIRMDLQDMRWWIPLSMTHALGPEYMAVLWEDMVYQRQVARTTLQFQRRAGVRRLLGDAVGAMLTRAVNAVDLVEIRGDRVDDACARLLPRLALLAPNRHDGDSSDDDNATDVGRDPLAAAEAERESDGIDAGPSWSVRALQEMEAVQAAAAEVRHFY